MEENELVQVTSATDQPQCDQLHADFWAYDPAALDVIAGKIVENPAWHGAELTHAHADFEMLGELIFAALTSADKAGYARGLQDAPGRAEGSEATRVADASE